MNEEVPQDDANTTTAPRALVICGVLLLIALALYVLRIYTRFRRVYKIRAEDLIISLAVALEIVAYSMMAAAASYGLGRHDKFVTPGNRAQALRFVFTYEMTVSIQLAAALASTICLFIQCRPLRAMWDVVPDARCWAPPQLHIYGFVYTGIGILTDVIFVIMPLPIIWRLHRPLRERLIIAFLLSLILCATAAASVKLYYVRVIVLEGEQLRSLVAPTLWSRIEEIALIAAACAPSLKSSTEDGLRQCWHCCARHRQQERSSSCVSESDRSSLRAFLDQYVSASLRVPERAYRKLEGV
ncbi:uncharacterized protein BO88DRAFT_454791 [Aspergillus vadensis CBS 113365]|uniref:Rhodopsin domain-containing protein n=1 Tax=Aspergillus vadensis (strain CBS 113365 / IMI 142717 / IBT 24658) TaxID=1448311 RepID=A0A319CI35_ASPVC|nr:hypothetical protein BO88DRAFT_454791 [Aspergillus vadensis CBS 113365]PYH67892.1 hypothetical protein BO88DRAFT_454791 [Aspergillus vadensis CBS 113365]